MKKRNIIHKKKKRNNEETINIRRSNSKRVILMLVVIFFIGIYLTFLFYQNYKIIDYFEISARVKIQESGGGFNLENTSLNFGKNFPGGWGQRFIEINSSKDAIVRIKAVGDMENFLTFSDNNFFLPANKHKQVSVTMDVPENISLGNYTGKVKIYFLRP